MKTIRILKYAFLLILVTTAVYYASFFIKVYINHGSVGKTETLFGFWSLPLFIVSSFLYAFLSRASE